MDWPFSTLRMDICCQAKQKKECESLQILELTEANIQPEPAQAALLQDKDSSSGQEDEDRSSPIASVAMYGQA